MYNSRFGAVVGLTAALMITSACASSDGLSKAERQAVKDKQVLADERAAISRADPLTQARYWRDEYNTNPADRDVIVGFARALRGIGSHQEALDALSKGLALNPDDTEMLLISARALVSMKRLDAAEATYRRLIQLTPQDPSALAGLAVVLDEKGQHRAAQDAYRQALAIDPGRPSTLSNLALSLVLSGDVADAEQYLRQAVDLPGASPIVRQNLALVVGLQGRFDEMREIGGKDLPDELANANVEIIRRMLTPGRSYESIASD